MGFEEYSKIKLVDTIHFMEILTLKDSVKKDTFFHKFPNVAEQLPCQNVLKRQEASALEFGYGASPGLTALLKMGTSLSVEEFSVKVLPTIVKLFSSNNHVIRVRLLEHMDSHCQHKLLMSNFLNVLYFKVIGLHDLFVDPTEVSFLKVDEEPAIRTNTTILLGNIASYLDEGTTI
ncbi:hypothetical protein OIU77_004406 [Salix suchowensis]|uniref:Uncharacterized protein n=1 Tax=Salix suchowensis TaxID=1278906 RepID=A0ABQ9AVK4_9ROSI|nr:hypothetical protein OIU77_004406 [Salix suchowensis]